MRRLPRLAVPLLLFSIALIVLLSTPYTGDAGRTLAFSVRALLGNGISELGTDEDFVWVGTDAGISRLRLDDQESGDWSTFTGEDGLAGVNITAMAIGSGAVWVAAAHDSSVQQSEVSDGISVTRDGGATWQTFRPERGFGLANTVWGLAVTGQTVWAATWNAFGLFDTGLIRSRNGGQTWEAINPNPNPQGEFTFSVMADGDRVWVGTAGGVSRSGNDGATWHVSTTAEGLTGNWVFALDTQTISGDSILWAGAWPSAPGERYGVVRSLDGGATWTAITALADRQAIDFAFSDSTVWIATFDGLWTSPDAGLTWQRLDASEGLADTAAVSVHARGDTVWVGSGQNGLSVSYNGGQTWQTLRASMPTAFLGTSARADTIQTYAFPNPFSPINHGVTRIRYSLFAPEQVTVEVFDAASSPVRTLLDRAFRPAGEQFVPWDGKNGRNIRASNGVYFYRISTQNGLHAYGKIILLD